MKTIKFLSTATAGFLLFFGAAQAASASVITVQSETIHTAYKSQTGAVGGDWWLNTTQLDTNGDWSAGTIGLVKFDLSGVLIPAGEHIESVSLLLAVKSNNGSGTTADGHIQLHRITKAVEWDGTSQPNGALAQNYDKASAGDLAGFDEKNGGNQILEIPLDAALVRGWLDGTIANGGLAVWNLSTDGGHINTGNYPTGWGTAAQLKITTAPVPEPASLSLLVLGGLLMGRHRGR